MKTTIVLLTIVLVASLTFNFYQYMDGNETTPCDNKGRYLNEKEIGASRIPKTDADRLIEEFRNHNPLGEGNNTGFILTKRMFDELFQNPELNSVALDLIMIDEKLTLTVQGHKTDYTKIDGEINSNVYVIRSFCPTDCER